MPVRIFHSICGAPIEQARNGPVVSRLEGMRASGAEAPIDLNGIDVRAKARTLQAKACALQAQARLVYGLKPVPFKLGPVPFKLTQYQRSALQ